MKTSKIVLFAALFLILFGVIFILIVNDSYKYKITYEDKQYTYEIKVFEKIIKVYQKNRTKSILKHQTLFHLDFFHILLVFHLYLVWLK